MIAVNFLKRNSGRDMLVGAMFIMVDHSFIRWRGLPWMCTVLLFRVSIPALSDESPRADQAKGGQGAQCPRIMTAAAENAGTIRKNAAVA
jgi:hypothetical protein